MSNFEKVKKNVFWKSWNYILGQSKKKHLENVTSSELFLLFISCIQEAGFPLDEIFPGKTGFYEISWIWLNKGVVLWGISCKALSAT